MLSVRRCRPKRKARGEEGGGRLGLVCAFVQYATRNIDTSAVASTHDLTKGSQIQVFRHVIMTRCKPATPKARGEEAGGREDKQALDHDALEVREMVDAVREDLLDIEKFYTISFSATRISRVTRCLELRLSEVDNLPYEHLDIQSQMDAILLRKFIKQRLCQCEKSRSQTEELADLIEPFTSSLVSLIERRQRLLDTDGKGAADILDSACDVICERIETLRKAQFAALDGDQRFVAFRSIAVLKELNVHLTEWFNFFHGYNAAFTWWIKAPYAVLSSKIEAYSAQIREALVGLEPDDEDAIVGQPCGRDALEKELDLDFIAYSPEELIDIAEKEYAWCEKEAKKAAVQLACGEDWRSALNLVKRMFVPPGDQPRLVRELADQAVDYVRRHDMITVPDIAADCWPAHMMSPERQKVNPFFLGGDEIIISYPTDTMSHKDKMMSLRGNAQPLSRSTVFHELIPGHHLQFHYMKRFRPYRTLFENGMWTEGWAFYWEMLLWDRDYPVTAANKIGMLFWRMHRCIRIIFSLKFHLGKATPEECIDMLVERVGHERATAEGEVRRSFNGDYPPLYQAAYMIGALQFSKFRREMVEDGSWSEKKFHDTVLKQGPMAIEILRALLRKRKLSLGHKSEWRFYESKAEEESTQCAA